MNKGQIFNEEIDYLWREITALKNLSEFAQKVRFYFLANANNNVLKYELTMDEKDITPLIDMVRLFYEKGSFRAKNILEYDPVSTSKSTHQYCPNQIQYRAIFQSCCELADHDDALSGIDENEIKQYTDYLIRWVDTEGEKLYMAIGSMTVVTSLKRVAFIGLLERSPNRLDGNHFKKVVLNNAFGLSGNLDTVIWVEASKQNDPGAYKILIHGVRGFERVFRLNEIYKEAASSLLSGTAFSKHIEENTLAKLEDACKSGGRIARRLSKLNSDPERLDAFFSNISRVKAMLGDSHHPNKEKFRGVEYDERMAQLRFTPGSSLRVDNLVNLLSDGSYQAEISGVTGYDKSR